MIFMINRIWYILTRLIIKNRTFDKKQFKPFSLDDTHASKLKYEITLY